MNSGSAWVGAGRRLGKTSTQRGPWCLGLWADRRSKGGVFGWRALPAIDRISMSSVIYWGAAFRIRHFMRSRRSLRLTDWRVGKATGKVVLRLLRAFDLHVGDVLAGTRAGVMPISMTPAQLWSLGRHEGRSRRLFKPKGHNVKVTAKGGDRGSRDRFQWVSDTPHSLCPCCLATFRLSSIRQIRCSARRSMEIRARRSRSGRIQCARHCSDDFHLHRTAPA